MARLTWNDIFQHGTLISMHRSKWQAKIRITLQDLGIEDSADTQAALTLGGVVAAPSKSFRKINAAITAWESTIEEHSLAFSILESVRFVPDNQLQELQRKLDLKMRDFNIAVDEFLDAYDATMLAQLPLIERALIAVAKTPEAAAEALSRVTREYPSRQKVASKFGITWQFFTISIPASDAAAQAARSSVPQVTEALQGMIGQLRNNLSAKVLNLIDLANKVIGGKSRTKDGFGESSIKSVEKELDKIDRLNFFGDPVLSEQTKMLRNLLTGGDNDLREMVRDLNKVQSSLESDITAAADAAEQKLTSLGKRKITL